jgi:UDP-N-acetylmuramoyl-L-alanyl-D-glutamate--2,6-diaminopimelate ligase
MKLSELMMPFHDAISRGNLSVEVLGLTEDSRSVKPGMLFIAVKGTKSDGHQHLNEAVAAGAAGLVVKSGLKDVNIPSDWQLPVIEVPNTRRFLGALASRFYGYPAARLKMIGVTGTNGKTTTTYVCKAILEAAGKQAGLIGTVSYVIGSEEIAATHTTPGALELQALLKKMADAGLEAVIMEVSSHALALDRTAGCAFDAAVFTNLTQDHLDFHTDMEDYFQAKLRLFTQRGAHGRAIVNADDPYGERIAAAFSAATWRYGIDGAADIRAEGVRISLEGVEFVVRTPFGSAEIHSPLVGRHNVYNILGAIGAGLQQGIDLPTIAQGISRLGNVPGRFERVEAGQPFTVVVDYAHTDDALYRLLSTAQAVKTGRIITVFGCGGDRDRGKRPKMGRIAALYSDVVVVTSDNPRTEDAGAIIEEIEPGVKAGLQEAGRGKYVIRPDRRDAIETAMREARAGDLVLIAGKGHEDYQVIGTTKHPFDDRVVAREALQALKRRA